MFIHYNSHWLLATIVLGERRGQVPVLGAVTVCSLRQTGPYIAVESGTLLQKYTAGDDVSLFGFVHLANA